jgi:hypothetical protein
MPRPPFLVTSAATTPPSSKSTNHALSFAVYSHKLTRPFSHNSFVCTSIQNPGGVAPKHSSSTVFLCAWWSAGGFLSLCRKSYRFSKLPPLVFSCLSFSHSLSLFSINCTLFSQNTRGMGIPDGSAAEGWGRCRMPQVQFSTLRGAFAPNSRSDAPERLAANFCGGVLTGANGSALLRNEIASVATAMKDRHRSLKSPEQGKNHQTGKDASSCPRRT